MIFNTNVDIPTNIRANIIAKNRSLSRWGNLFKKYFSKHIETIYDDYPAYSFKSGMLDCTSSSGSISDRIDEAENFKDILSTIDGLFTATLADTNDDEYDTSMNIEVVGVTFEDDSVDFGDIDLNDFLDETIAQRQLYDYDYFEENLLTSDSVDVDSSVVLDYITELIQELNDAINEESRTNDDLEIINHLGLCDTLNSEISRPHKIKKIWFRFRKKNNAPKIYEDGILIGYDPNYEWWNESQFEEINRRVKDFKEHCIFVGDFDDNGALDESYIYLNISFLSLSGIKIYYFVKTFLDIGVTSKKSFFRQILGVALFVVGIYLTAISANPTWLKVAIIIASIASYSGVLSNDAQFALLVVSFAYGAYQTDFSSMSSIEMFNYAFEHIDVIFSAIAYYKYNNSEKTEKSQNQEVEQDRAIQFVYSDSFDSFSVYENMYEEMTTSKI